MRNLIKKLVPLIAVLGIAGAAHAAPEKNFWTHPGRHPLAASYEAVMQKDARRAELIKLGVPADMIGQIMNATDTPGRMEPLKDGECFQHQLFEGGKIANSICVNFGNAPYDRRAERWTIVDTRTGTRYEITHPYVCHNLSLNIVPPAPPPPKSRCFVVHFDYQSNAHVMATGNLMSAGALVASGLWHGSPDQSYLNDDTLFAFVVMHMDFEDAGELARFANDDCTGVTDATGFHHILEWDCELCTRGEWPPAGMLDELFAMRGIRLPAQKPSGAFRFPCATGKCTFSMPLWAARAFLACVEVPQYAITLGGFYGWRDADNFDIVSAVEIHQSLARKAHAKGDIVLSNTDGSTRYLTGAGSYTLPGSY